MSWQEVLRIQQLESKVRKLEDRLTALEARGVINVLGHRQEISAEEIALSPFRLIDQDR